MDPAKVIQVGALMLGPTIAIGILVRAPAALRALRQLFETEVEPRNPPFEGLAADLRRLLREHEQLRHSSEVPVRGLRLRALEAAISDRAVETARAVGVPCPDRPASGVLPTPELRVLLHRLAEAGVVLPHVGLLT